jgi:hypothetical protein
MMNEVDENTKKNQEVIVLYDPELVEFAKNVTLHYLLFGSAEFPISDPADLIARPRRETARGLARLVIESDEDEENSTRSNVKIEFDLSSDSEVLDTNKYILFQTLYNQSILFFLLSILIKVTYC